jgi:hypothetical protein
MHKEHIYQLGGFIVALFVAMTPLAIWINNTSISQASNAELDKAIIARMDRQERDISEQRQDQRLITQNLIDVKTGFARIDSTIESFLREKSKR